MPSLRELAYRLYAHRFDVFPVVKLSFRLQGKDPDNFVVQSDTDLCVEGFPRSANSFLVRMIHVTNEIEIAHHTHAVANIREAIRNRIPTTILIRDPLDAAVSAAIYANEETFWRVFSDFIRFYTYVEEVEEHLLICKFETATNEVNRVINGLNQTFDAGFKPLSSHNEAERKVQADIQARYQGDTNLRTEAREKIPIPKEDRSRLKERLRPKAREHRLLDPSRELYRRLIDEAPHVV